MTQQVLSLLVLPIASLCVGAELDLAGRWTLEGPGEFLEPLFCAAAVPGDVHSALRAAGLMKDQFFGRNETAGRRVRIPADGTLKVAEAASRPETFLMLTLTAGGRTFANEWLSRPFRDCDLADASVKAKFDGLSVTLDTDRPAFFVWANVRGVRGEFTDNSFTLLPGHPVTLAFNPEQPLTPGAFREAFTVTHLRRTC